MSNYRLPEQQVGNRWVYPYVDESSERYTITLAVVLDPLQSRDQEPPTLSAEELKVELRDQQERSLEVVEGPEGPLAVAGGPSYTANAEFGFSRNQAVAEVLEVAIAGASAKFLFRNRLHEKKDGNGWSLGDFIRKLRRLVCLILCLIRKLLGRPRCCPTRFDVPDNRSGCQTAATFARESFEMNADFSSGEPCRCGCCEYRQYVRGRFLFNGRVHRHPLPGGPLSATTFQEDGIPNFYSPGRHAFYGHRADPGFPTDVYRAPDRATGCEYRGFDQPGISGPRARYEVDLEFRGEIIDACCCNKVLRSTTWRVRCQNFA